MMTFHSISSKDKRICIEMEDMHFESGKTRIKADINNVFKYRGNLSDLHTETLVTGKMLPWNFVGNV